MKPEWDSQSDDETESGKVAQWWGGYAATVFLIEATQAMFEQDINDKSYFAKCIECCKAHLLQQIRSSKKGPTAIILFGTKQGTDSWNNVTVLQDFSQPSADRVKQLTQLLESNDFDQFYLKYGHSDDFSIANALWYCHQLISGYTAKLSSKSIIMMTCTSNPHANDPDKQKQAKIHAEGFRDVAISLYLVPLGSQFDKNAFYSRLLQNAQDDDFVGIEDPSESADELIQRINRCGSQKRSVGRITWHLGDGAKLSVAIFNFVQETSVPSGVRLSRETNEEVQVKTQMFNRETGDVEDEVIENRFVRFGGEKISFTLTEWREAREIAEPGIKLLGFKPKTCVNYYFKKPAFIYPDEQLIKGSRTLFAALHERCLAREQVPICLFTPRKSSPPKLVALWPQEDELDSHGFQIRAPGFVVIYLPYANNIRDLSNFHSKVPADDDLKTISKRIIDKLIGNYHPHAIKNPRIETHWAMVEAIALGLTEPKQVKDETVPDEEEMREKLGHLAEDFKSLAFGPDFDESALLNAAAKRAQPAAERAAKKPKIELDISNMRAIAEAQQVDKLKVDQLKEFLKGEGYSIGSLKKAGLVAKVYEHFEMDAP